MKSWGSSTDPVTFTDLTSRPCQKDDFLEYGPTGPERSPYGFHHMDEATNDILNGSNWEIKCIDDDFEIRGDFNSKAASNLLVTFTLCNPLDPAATGATKCKGQDEIDEALSGSYLLLIENVERYKHQNSPTSGKMFKYET